MKSAAEKFIEEKYRGRAEESRCWFGSHRTNQSNYHRYNKRSYAGRFRYGNSQRRW